MIYSELETYIVKEVVRDRAILQDGHFLRLLNLTLLDMARDLNTIDSDFYMTESEHALEFDVEINLGQSLGFSGGLLDNDMGWDNSYAKKEIPRVSSVNKRTPFGIKDKFDASGDLLVVMVDNSAAGLTFVDTTKIILFYSRKPYELTGVGTQAVDMPEQLMYELGLLFKHHYYDSRGFSDEADRANSMYRARMNNYVKKKAPSGFSSEIGKTMVTDYGYYSAFR